MQTLLEIFYTRMMAEEVRYRRKLVDLSEAREDPERVIESLIRQRYHISSVTSEDEFVIHSTSWRYKPPDQIILTYVAYSDELAFDQGEFQNLPLEELKPIPVSRRRPGSPIELERQVITHAMRHIAFLVKTDDQDNLKDVLKPETREIFEALWVALAGRVF